MPRYSGPARVRIHGPQGVGAAYIPLARTLLGDQIAIYVEAYDSSRGVGSHSHVSKNYTPQPAEQIQRRVSLPNGVNVRVQYNTYMPVIDIWVPEGVGAEQALEFRGLLRALQDKENPCEPLDEDEFSELHPLYQQWLIYPDEGLSVEHNGFPNYPLPPRGGTFIMDMIGMPFDRRAFQGKPSVTDCKMLVTGGGTDLTDDNLYYGAIEWGDDDYIMAVGPKRFRVARMDEMSGWPWRDQNGVERLVSVSAVFKVPYDWYMAYGDIHIEFLKLNGEPFKESDGGYLEPIDIYVEDIWGDYIGFENTFWYDLTVQSLTRRGNKAIIGLNQAGYQYTHGMCLDFIVLDLEAEDEEDVVTFKPRYDFFVNNTFNYSHSRGANIDNVAFIELDDTYSEDSGITGKPWLRHKVTLVDKYERVDGDWYFPSSYSTSYSWEGEVTWHLYFDSAEELVQCFHKVTGTFSWNRTQTLTTEAGEDGETLSKFRAFPVHTTASTASYAVGDIVYLVMTLDGFVCINAFLCVQAHSGSFATRPGLTGSPRVDLNPLFWRFVYGKRTGRANCAYQTWNGFTVVDPPPENCDGYTPPFGPSEYGVVCGYLWLGDTRVFSPSQQDKAGAFRQRLDSTSSYNVAETHYIGKRVLGGTDPDTILFDAHYTNSWDTTSAEIQSVDHHYCAAGYARSPTIADWYSSRGYRWTGGVESQTKTFKDLSHTANCGSMPSMSTACTPTATQASPVSNTNSGGNDYLIFPATYGVGQQGDDYVPSDDDSTNDGPFYFGGIEFSGFSTIGPFPVDGVGVGFTYGFTNNCNRSGNCVANSQIRYSINKETCLATAASGYVNTDVTPRITNTLSFGEYRYWEAESATDPMPFAPNTDNDGILFEVVHGPEINVICANQQIAYVGWVYPQEVVSNES